MTANVVTQRWWLPKLASTTCGSWSANTEMSFHHTNLLCSTLITNAYIYWVEMATRTLICDMTIKLSRPWRACHRRRRSSRPSISKEWSTPLEDMMRLTKHNWDPVNIITLKKMNGITQSCWAPTERLSINCTSKDRRVVLVSLITTQFSSSVATKKKRGQLTWSNDSISNLKLWNWWNSKFQVLSDGFRAWKYPPRKFCW